MDHAGQGVEVLEAGGSLQGSAFSPYSGSGTILGGHHPWRIDSSTNRFRASLAGLAHGMLSHSGPSSAGLPEAVKRRMVVSRFVSTAVSGDVSGFEKTLHAIDWCGAWPELFHEIVRVGFVHPDVQPAFRDAWRGAKGMVNGADIVAERMGWSLTRDFEECLDLLVDGLRLLMPQTPTPPIYALYRGVSLAEHEAGRHGVWWTPDPIYAELYGQMPSRTRSGPGAVVVAIAPHDAVITTLCHTEFLVDPRHLEDVVLVAELRPNGLTDLGDPIRNPQLQGIPSGYSFEDLNAWLEAGLPAKGLISCKRAREQQMALV